MITLYSGFLGVMSSSSYEFVAGLPVGKFCVSPYTAMIETTVGGHIGFTDTLWPSGPALVDKIFAEYSRACFNYKMEID